jgi:hypothetical protein
MGSDVEISRRLMRIRRLNPASSTQAAAIAECAKTAFSGSKLGVIPGTEAHFEKM